MKRLEEYKESNNPLQISRQPYLRLAHVQKACEFRQFWGLPQF